MKKSIPAYFISKKNTVIQIIFTTLFAYAFINLYKPFGSKEWYDVTWWVFSLVSGLLVIAGMLVVLASRLFMFWVKRRSRISILYYVLMIAGEIVFMAVLYVFLERLVLKDMRPFAVLIYFSIQNTSLILLIPSIISLLFFAWQEKKISLERLARQISHKADFIPFKDEKGILRITLKSNDLIYLQACDNYVIIYYEVERKMKSYLIRNTLKQFEKDLLGFPLVRCHRSYTVNINRIKMMKREKGIIRLVMEDIEQHIIPVSRSYVGSVTKLFSSDIAVGGSSKIK